MNIKMRITDSANTHKEHWVLLEDYGVIVAKPMSQSDGAIQLGIPVVAELTVLVENMFPGSRDEWERSKAQRIEQIHNGNWEEPAIAK